MIRSSVIYMMIVFAAGLIGCSHIERLLSTLTRPNSDDYRAHYAESASKGARVLFEPVIFKVYCGKNEVKFKKEYWDDIFLACDEFQKLQDSCIEIYGYTSNDGSYDYNVKLGKARGEWVRRCLVAEQVADNYIEIITTEPLQLPANAIEKEKAKCRCVEVHIVPCSKTMKERRPSHIVDPADPFHYGK